MLKIFLFSLGICLSFNLCAQTFLSDDDMSFLKNISLDVIEASRIAPDQIVSSEFGCNSTGGTLIRPGGRDCYPSFWIRDYAMSLDSHLIPKDEQLHMLLLTASTQCDQSWITKNGSFIPLGSIADHIRIDDSLPIYFPGTYSYEEQGSEMWGSVPPYCDQFYFVHMLSFYHNEFKDKKILEKKVNDKTLLQRAEDAFNIVPSDLVTKIVYTTDKFRGVDFGFRDAQVITGYLAYPSILKYRAACELSQMCAVVGRSESSEKYASIAELIKRNLYGCFSDERGLLKASTGKSSQADVWSSALAVYWKIVDEEASGKIAEMLSRAYNEGTLSYKGNIRHMLTTDDFDESTAWEHSFAAKNTYQNGAYWGTPVGWVCYTIAKKNLDLAKKLASEYVAELRENDYRKGAEFGAPYECFHPNGNCQNPVYMTSVTSPLEVFLNYR